MVEFHLSAINWRVFLIPHEHLDSILSWFDRSSKMEHNVHLRSHGAYDVCACNFFLIRIKYYDLQIRCGLKGSNLDLQPYPPPITQDIYLCILEPDISGRPRWILLIKNRNVHFILKFINYIPWSFFAPEDEIHSKLPGQEPCLPGRKFPTGFQSSPLRILTEREKRKGTGSIVLLEIGCCRRGIIIGFAFAACQL